MESIYEIESVILYSCKTLGIASLKGQAEFERGLVKVLSFYQPGMESRGALHFYF